MNKAQQFQKEIAAHPKDVEPRLAYAEWLEQNGEPLGEFIRVQCQLQDTDIADQQYDDLKSRELQLLRQHNKGWGKSIRPLVRNWEYRNGLIDRVCMNAEAFLKHRQTLFKQHPIQYVELRNAYEFLDELADCKELKKLRGLSFAFCKLGRGGTRNPIYDRVKRADPVNVAASLRPFETFLSSPNIRKLEELDLNGNFVGTTGVEMLVNAGFKNLRSLDLRVGQVDAQGIEMLLKFKKLEQLQIGSCPNISHSYDEVGIGEVPIALAKLLPQLKSLNAGSSGLSLNGLGAMNILATDSKLESLSIERTMTHEASWTENSQTIHALRDFIGSFGNLKQLNIASCYLSGKQYKILGEQESEQPLFSLDLDNNNFEAKTGKLLGSLPRFKELKRLSLNGCEPLYVRIKPDRKSTPTWHLCTKGFSDLLLSDALAQLSWASVRKQTLGGRIFYKGAEYLKRFWYLDLSTNLIGDAAAKKLIEFGPWPKLALLNLRDNKLKKSTKDQLKKTFGYRVLV